MLRGREHGAGQSDCNRSVTPNPIPPCHDPPMSCSCSTPAADLAERQRQALKLVLAINLLAFAVMVAGSLLSGSSALLSGTLDNLGDALTCALSLLVVGASLAAKARVALLKGLLILAAALAVAVQIGWRLSHLETPVVHTMTIAAVLNLAANTMCLAVLNPLRGDDLNMSSIWECSRNDVLEGIAVLVTAGAVWIFDSGWPDVLVALLLLVLFLNSAIRVLRAARREARPLGGGFRWSAWRSSGSPESP